MIDIEFYQRSYALKRRIMDGEEFDREYIFSELEKLRSDTPVIYNMETTNNCNARCYFCPRTTMMTRGIEDLDLATFKKIASQMRPWTDQEWTRWKKFVKETYNVSEDEMNQNHFFMYIIARTIVGHGMGDPLLDKKLGDRIEILKNNDIGFYFSCNPSNINVSRTIEMMKRGLEYIKYSLDSVDDITHKKLRGRATNFSKAYAKICDVLEQKESLGLDTNVVITMIDLGRPNQKEEWEMLQEYFSDKDVYIYLKSQDQTYLEDKELDNQSIDWVEYCQFPWSSLSIKSDGKVAMCSQDFNNMVIVGDAKTQSLQEIWNSSELTRFRRSHIFNSTCEMCSKYCDKRPIGDFNLKG